MDITRWSVMQLLLVAGISRRFNRKLVVKAVGCDNSYYTNIQAVEGVDELLVFFQKLEITDDIKEVSKRSLYRMVAKLVLQMGEVNG